MTHQMFRFALGVTIIVAACGGDGNGPLPDGSDEVVCGDGTCTDGLESFSSCPDDCVAPPNCGDGTCGSDESCSLCAQDCACQADQMCSEDGACVSAPQCGDGVCERSVQFPGDVPTEDCALCPQDCGCTGEQVCRSWEALGWHKGCGGIPEDLTRYCGSVCGHPNPLIDVIPGSWRLIEPDVGERDNIFVDTSAPACDIAGHEAGDACVIDDGLAFVAVLTETRLFLRAPPADYYLEGQVLEGGRRIEYDYGAPEGPFDHLVWVKEE